MYVCMHACMSVCMYVRMHACMYVSKHLSCLDLPSSPCDLAKEWVLDVDLVAAS